MARAWEFEAFGRRVAVGRRDALRGALALVLAVELLVIHFFGKFVMLQQEIFAQGSRIEVEYQRRENLIPRLAGIAKDYARHEQDLMRYVADARTLKQSSSRLGGVLGPAKSAEAERVFSKLIALAEQYPDLKAERSYQALMAKLVTTENRVAAARERYSVLINDYNRTIVTFPSVVFAKLLGFEEIGVYEPEKEPRPGKTRRFFFIY